MNIQPLIERINKKQVKVGIIGLGYVGLPLALTFLSKGFEVVGLDTDLKKVEQLKQGRSCIRHVSSDEVAKHIDSGKFTVVSKHECMHFCGVVIICVPTPLNANREPNMSFIEKTVCYTAPYLKDGSLLILESTTYPGTTDTLVKKFLELHDMKVGENIFLAFSPEREDPGNAKYNTKNIPKIVGGVTPACQEVAKAFYKAALDKVVAVSSARTAEMTKLLENIFRSVNIALVNELKIVCDAMGIDIWEVIEAASTKPFGFMPFYPGPGLGGHCIPVDPFYLSWKAREYDLTTKFIELAGEINTSMHHYVLDKITHGLNSQEKSVKGKHILIVGIAYKPDIDDMRESPSLALMTMLMDLGAHVHWHDNYVQDFEPDLDRSNLSWTNTTLNAENLKSFDAVVIMTKHTYIDYQHLLDHSKLVIDCRNATKGLEFDAEKVVKA